MIERESKLAPARANDADAEPRKAHYGAGRQPWDDILAEGWGPHFAAACILRYLRRDKAVEHSIESARWYAARIAEGAFGRRYGDPVPWLAVSRTLGGLLTDEEAERIGELIVKLSTKFGSQCFVVRLKEPR